MGTVHKLAAARDEVTLGEAVERFLATLDHPETAGTHRVYGSTLAIMLTKFGGATEVGIFGSYPDVLREWFAGRWGEARPATWNTKRGTLRSFFGYCEDHRWIGSADDAIRGIETRKVSQDRGRALSRGQVQALLTREDIPLRERTLWRVLYETAARSAEVLRLNVSDLDMPNRTARVRRKGGAMDIIVWQTGTARLLPRLLRGRRAGPVFLTEKRSRVQLPPRDLDPASGLARLSYERAEQLFKAHSGGATLHQLRHSALTHAAEDGVSTPMMMARSGHTSVRSLVRYARVSAEALQRHQARADPARRR
jgi:integrase/recombinase XerC/integrase/recombinase XerD